MGTHTFGVERNGSKVVWDVKDIWEAVEELPTTKLPFKSFDKLTAAVFKDFNDDDYERSDEADLNYPIIVVLGPLNTVKYIIDGYHRLYRHKELKHSTIPVKIIYKMPKPLYCKGKPFEIEGLDFDWYDPRKK